ARLRANSILTQRTNVPTNPCETLWRTDGGQFRFPQSNTRWTTHTTSLVTNSSWNVISLPVRGWTLHRMGREKIWP
ncbi:uncharacterized protein METZ01_LOCUS292551, partial [marine metagenome]